MKIKMPKISSKVNYQIIMIFILLVVVVFITAMPWASNTFHEALENITPSGEDIENKIKTVTEKTSQSSTPSKKSTDISTMLTNIKNITPGNISSSEPKKEGFVSEVSFRDSATSYPGAPIDTTNWNSTQDIEATPLNRNSLYMFDNARFSPNCCMKGPGSGMSSSMGCICLKNDDAYYITQGRGGGNVNPSDIF